MKWMNMGKEIKASGERTTFYCDKSGRFTIESRKRLVPHANGVGGWMFTSYWLIDNNEGTEKQYYRLADAKEAAEEKMNHDRT